MKALLAVPSLYKNSKPLSLLSSELFWPIVIIGSATVVTVLLTVVVVPLTVKFPLIAKLPATSTLVSAVNAKIPSEDWLTWVPLSPNWSCLELLINKPVSWTWVKVTSSPSPNPNTAASCLSDKSSLNSALPAEDKVIASAVVAVPIVAPSATLRLPLNTVFASVIVKLLASVLTIVAPFPKVKSLPLTVKSPPTLTSPVNAVVDDAAAAPPVIVITDANAPEVVVATCKSSLPDSDPEVTAGADAIILAKSWLFWAASLVLKRIVPATSSATPLLVPLSLERVKIPPAASLVSLKILVDGLKVLFWRTAVSFALKIAAPFNDTLPAPLAAKFKLILLSVPSAEMDTASPVADGVILIKFTALLVVAKERASLPLASAIKPPSANLGAVKVLLVRVWACALKVNSSLPVSNGKLIFLSAVSSLTVNVYWWSLVVSLIWGVVKVGLLSKVPVTVKSPLIFTLPEKAVVASVIVKVFASPFIIVAPLLNVTPPEPVSKLARIVDVADKVTLPVEAPVALVWPKINLSEPSSQPMKTLAASPLSNTKPTSLVASTVPVAPVPNSTITSFITVLSVETLVVVPLTVKLPSIVWSPVTWRSPPTFVLVKVNVLALFTKTYLKISLPLKALKEPDIYIH